MRISPQIGGSSIVALGNLNPLIFRPDWLQDKEILIGSDRENAKIEIIHPEVVALTVPWGHMQVERERFVVTTAQEPLVRACDFFVKCFQALPETPISAVGLNREVHFPTASESARDRVGDTLAPKEFWGDFVNKDGTKAGGLRSLTMEQSIVKDGRRARLDGKYGWVHVRVEPSLRNEVAHGLFVAVNDHFDLTQANGQADGRLAAEVVSESWEDSIRSSEFLIDRVMELASGH